MSVRLYHHLQLYVASVCAS